MPGDKRTVVMVAALSLAVLAWVSLLLPSNRTLQVAFLDVGDGLCTVIRSPSGRTMVMDCGTSSWLDNESVGEKVTARYLQSMGVDSIDIAVLSHPHSDHMSGYPGLFAIEPAKMVLDIGEGEESPEYAYFLRTVRKCGSIYKTAKRGQILDMGDGVSAEVLNPDPRTPQEDENNKSIVLRLTYKNSAFLLAADAGIEAEQDMLNSGINPRAQVLQVGHHGSQKSTSIRWLDAVKPDIAVISCARNSRYNFPSETIIERLKSSGARVYITGKNGAVVFTTDGHTIRCRTFKSTCGY